MSSTVEAAAPPRTAARRLRWPAALADREDRRKAAGWLGLGLLVRFAVMPFTATSDLLAVYWRSHLIAYDGTFFDAYLVNMGAHYVHAAALRILAPLLPDPDALWTDPWWWADSFGLAPQVMARTVGAPDAFATLFVLKLPYLAADLAAGVVLYLLLARARPALARRAWVFWMLSPIGLYASFLFGRYEAFPVLCVVLALLAVERNRPWWGAMALGVAITMRGYPLLLLPVFALVAVRGPLRQAGWAGLGLVPFALVMATNRLLAGAVGELATLRDAHTGTTFFAYSLPVDAIGQLSVFFLAAFLLYGIVAGRQYGWWGSGPVLPGELWVWLLVLHAAMFGLATFSAHYFAWLAPFVALALARRPAWRGTLWLHLAQVTVVLALADLLGGPAVGVVAPVLPGSEAPAPLYEALLTSSGLTEQLAGLLRTGFLALTLLLVWPALAELLRGGRRTLSLPAAGV